MELVDDGEHSRFHAKASEGRPPTGSGDWVIGCREVGKHMNSGVFFFAIPCRTLTAKAALSLRQGPFPFTAVTGATRYDFEGYFAGVRQEEDTTIFTKLRPIFIISKHHDRCTLQLLWHALSRPYSDVDIVEVFQGVRASFVGQGLQKPGREAIRPIRLAVRHRPEASSTPYLSWKSSSGLYGGHTLSPSTMIGSNTGDLGFSRFSNHLTQRSRMTSSSRSNLPFSS